MLKILTNLSTDFLEVELSGGRYDGAVLQMSGGQLVRFDYDVSVSVVDKQRERDLRIDTVQ